MNREQVHDLMENELRCVQRGNYCDRDCAKCPLVKDDKELIEAYGYVIKALEQEPCEDAISRKAVVEYIKASDADLGHDSENEFAVEDILNMPPVTPTQKWIPVSERLPKDRREVLVTAYWHETYQVMMASYFGDGLWWCVPFNNCGEHTQRLNPNAWMPLPEKYKAETEGEE